ncbi:MAG: NAD-binding protein [Acidobacteria bacterium]|nr:NAD-binding protein [Acidobacteriota bacterium]
MIDKALTAAGEENIMRVVILGCGRVGSTMALMLDSEGHDVSIIDMEPSAFRRLGESFGGRAVTGIGISADVLREAGIENASAFLAVTNGDNTNIMAAQIAKVLFQVPRAMARIYDPLRAEVYREVGIETLCITTLGAGIFHDRLLDRSYQSIDDYWNLTHEMHRLYAANLPTPQQLAEKRVGHKNGHKDYIIIAGGGKVGHNLGRALLSKGDEVLILEKRPQRFHMLHDELGEAVFFGDACEIRTMVQVGMERADLVVAVTGDDEDNLIICQAAKRWFGVPRAIGRVNNPANEDTFHKLGIEETISATRLMYQLIEQEVATMDVLPLSLLQRGNMEVVEIKMQPDAPVVNVPVRKLMLPAGCLLMAIIGENKAEIVTGDSRLGADDTVVALARPEALNALRIALLGA